MKFIIRDNENDLTISSNWITVLEIANKKLFSSYVRSLFALVNGKTPEKDMFLFRDGTEMNFSKSVMYVSDPLSIDYNTRRILTALQKRVEDIKNNEVELWNSNEDMFVSFSASIMQFLNELDLDLEYDVKFDVSALFKMLNIKISDLENSTQLEKLLKLIDVLTEIGVYEMVVFINIKAFLDYDEIQKFYTYCLYKKYPILLFESRLDELIYIDERKLIIDEEFEEFLSE